MSAIRVMVVEDERIVAEGLRKRLQVLGYEVPAVAATGEEAVAQVGAQRPDLVLMDISLAGEMDGIEAARQIREQFQVPVVYLTAYSTADVVKRAKLSEPFGYILKPYEERELHVVIETALYKHRMERTLRERESWLAAVLESIGDGVVATDTQGRLTYLNPRAEQLTGWTDAAARGRLVEDVIRLAHADTRQPLATPLHEAMRQRASVPLANHTVLLARDAHARPVEDCATPLLDAGTLLGGVMVFRDVSERHQAEQELARREEFLRKVIDLIPAFVVVKDRDSRFVMANRCMAEAYGTTVADLLGKADGAFNPEPGEVAAFSHADRQVIDARTPLFISEERFTGASGEVRWLQTAKVPLVDHDGNCDQLLAVAVDVTARRQAEAELRLRDRAVQAASQGIHITDPNQPDNPIIFASPGFERLTGYDAAAVLGRNCRFLQGPGTDRATVARLRAALRDAQPSAVEILNYRQDGTPFWCALTISPVRDADGTLTHFVGVQEDVTQRRQLEAQYRQAQKMEAVGRLAGGVAHDFNNLLTVINGYAQLLSGLLHQHDKAREMVGMIARAGERAAELTRQLLAYSRKQIQSAQVLDLNEVLAHAEKLLRRVIGEDVDLALSAGPSLRAVKADPGQLEQVVMNLAVNARDAMPTGGRLTITTRNVALTEPTAQGLFDIPPGLYVLLSVADTGCGMDAATLAHVFEPFFTTKPQGEGTGLGLAMAYGIVKQSDGYITVTSAPGKGTTFDIYLPALPEEERPAEPPAETEAVPTGTETILLVEDEEEVRTLTAYLLRHWGYAVLTAAGGAEALEVVLRHGAPIDLLVTDVVMPGMNGRQLAEALRFALPGLRVLYLSGYTDDAVLRAGVRESETAFLQKPFKVSALGFKVRAVLDN